MTESITKKKNKRTFIYVFVVMIFIVTSMLVYTSVQKKIITSYIEDNICSNTVSVAKVVNSSVGYGFNSIQVTASAISERMTSEELENPAQVLGEFIDKTPFTNIEYIRADGMNMTNAGDPFDASQREYFQNGIMGESGIWVNYHPKYSSNPLINFYSPLYYQGKVVGVLTGTVDSKEEIQSLLMSDLYGQNAVGVLIDEDNTIIACTWEFESGTSVDWENSQVFDDEKGMFLDAVDKADGSAFVLTAKEGHSIGSVSEVKQTGWKVIQVVAAPSVNKIMERTNVLAYTEIGIVLALSIILFTAIWIEKAHATKLEMENLRYKSNTDELTGVNNRNAYENDLPGCIINDDLVYVSMDVNSLKLINDTKGHSVGDALLIGAAECIRQAMGSYGKIYRIGGDEFAAVIYANQNQMNDIRHDFENLINEWEDGEITELSISYGYVQKSEFEKVSINEMARLADKRMYDAKAMYYRTKGVDRRGHKSAHAAICNLFVKVLKVNLTEDTYKIVSMEQNEQVKEKGYTGSISEWLREVGSTGKVYPEDLAEYFRYTNIDYLKEHFEKGNRYFYITYRRKIGNDYEPVMMEIIPTEEYRDDNQSMYLYVKKM